MVITILAGGRPKLLEQTLRSTFKQMPELKKEKIIALVNNGCEDSVGLLKGYGINKIVGSKRLLPIGDSISILAELAYQTKEKYWLHLEDDWQAMRGGVEKAVEILDKYEEITQVRLRLDSEKVLDKHMITGKPIKWLQQKGFKYAKAHYTFNPSVIRTQDILKPYPCTGERDAQKKWLDNGSIAQLQPGIYKHIGGGQSLREVTKCQV
jgi:hypothetical protein